MRRTLVALLTAATLVGAAACGTDEPGGGTAAPGQPDKVTVGVIPIVDVAPIYLGKQQGFFSDRNIDLDLKLAQGGAAIVPAVVAGQYQFGFSNVISLLLAQKNGLPLKVVANGVASTGVDDADFGGVVVNGDSPIQSAKDLVGKTVAANTLKNIVDTTVRESVRKDGADPSAVKFVEMPFPDMPAALVSKKVDAIFVVEPFLSAAKAQGGRVIASSYVDAAPNLVVATYFTSTDLISKNPDLVKRFTEAIKESLAYADAHPDEVRKVLSSYTQIKADQASALTLPKWPAEINKQAVQALAELAVKDGLLTAPPDLTALLP
jgi:NitT/TauT family transport system substrate-binding protein